MPKLNINSKKGFTIIEVVLVLAIAGLIFLMVFIALPALQRSQRDTQRKNDMGRLVTAISNYQADHRGQLPSTAELESTADNGFIKKYLITGGNDLFRDPNMEVSYKIDVQSEPSETKTQPTKADDGTIYWYPSATCDGDSVVKSTNKRNIAFLYKLESGGFYCGHN